MTTETIYAKAKTRTWFATWTLSAEHIGDGSYVFRVIQEDLSWRWNAIPTWVYGIELTVVRLDVGLFTISPPASGWNVFQPRFLNISGTAGGNTEGMTVSQGENNADLSCWYETSTDSIHVCLQVKDKPVEASFNLRLHWYFSSSRTPGESLAVVGD